jgi:hypothetical protein
MEKVMNEESQEAQTEAQTEAQAAPVNEKAQPKHVLLNAISYDEPADYDKFFNNLDVNQSLFVLMSGCTSAQTRGAYNLDEAELIAKAIKTIKSQSPQGEEVESEPVEDNQDSPNS